MIRPDLHTHTTFCDGKHTPEEMVLAAIDKGMVCLGFSAHAWVPGGARWCMPHEKAEAYRTEILRLRETYAGKIQILLGIEQDFYAETPAVGYDYVIGAVHEIHVKGRVVPVDESPVVFRRGVEQVFGGDVYALCEAYFALVAQVVEKTNADIIGHFDLVTKFNRDNRMFDELHPRYIRAWQRAADELLKTGKPFEINVGAIARGYREHPYPMAPVIVYLRDRGAKFILSGDSHSADAIAFQFDDWEEKLRAMGITLMA